MNDPEEIRQAIISRLSEVIDPETGVDVIRMRLIEDLTVDETGRASYKFRPSSVICPLAVPLSLSIKKAVSEVPGVSGQDFEIVGYLLSEELNQLLNDLSDIAK